MGHRASHRRLTPRARVDGTLTALLSEGKVLFDEFRVATRRSTDLIRDAAPRALPRQQTTALVGRPGVSTCSAWPALGVATARRRRRLGRALLEPAGDLHETIAELRAGRPVRRGRGTPASPSSPRSASSSAGSPTTSPGPAGRRRPASRPASWPRPFRDPGPRRPRDRRQPQRAVRRRHGRGRCLGPAG